MIGLGTLINTVANLRMFFENYAKTYASKVQLPYQQWLLETDVHAPDELRVNVQLANMDEFYQIYSINENDPMYIAPEDRVKIW